MTKKEMLEKLLEMLVKWGEAQKELRINIRRDKEKSEELWNNRQYRRSHELDKEIRYDEGMKNKLFFCTQEVISCIQDETGISYDGLSWDADKISRALDNVKKLKELTKK